MAASKTGEKERGKPIAFDEVVKRLLGTPAPNAKSPKAKRKKSK